MAGFAEALQKWVDYVKRVTKQRDDALRAAATFPFMLPTQLP